MKYLPVVQQQAAQGLGILATRYRERWPELSELPPEDICNFLSTKGWTWNPHAGVMGRWEKNNNYEEGEKPNGEEETR